MDDSVLCRLWVIPVLSLVLGSCAVKHAAAPSTRLAAGPRIVQPFDHEWRFYKGDAAGAERVDFNDAAWRTLDLPHDWRIEGPFDQTNPVGGAGAFLPAGVG